MELYYLHFYNEVEFCGKFTESAPQKMEKCTFSNFYQVLHDNLATKHTVRLTLEKEILAGI